jgi:hypothetical protein
MEMEEIKNFIIDLEDESQFIPPSFSEIARYLEQKSTGKIRKLTDRIPAFLLLRQELPF